MRPLTKDRSRIQWVRSQAVKVVCGIARGRRHLAPDLSYEMGVDLVTGLLWRRIAVYWGGIRQSRSLWTGCALAWGLALRGVHNGSLVLLGVPFWMLTLAAESPMYYGVSARGIGLVAAGAIGMVIIWRVQWVGWAAGLLYSTMAAWTVVRMMAEVFNGEWGNAFGAVVQGALVVVLVTVAAAFLNWGTVGLYALVVRGRDRRLSRGRSLFGLAAEQPVWLLQGGILLVGVTLGGVIGAFALWGWLAERAGEEVAPYVVGVPLLIWFVGLIWEYGIVRVVGVIVIAFGGAVLLGMYGGAIGGALTGLVEWVQRPVVAFGVGGTVGGIAIILGVLRAMRAIREREEWRNAVGPGQWPERLATLSPRVQARELRRVAKDRLGLQPEKFLEMLYALEGTLDTREEPVATAYWKLRAEVRQSMRQDAFRPTGDFLEESPGERREADPDTGGGAGRGE